MIALNKEEYEASVIEALKKKARNVRIAPLPEWVSEDGDYKNTTLTAGLKNSYTNYMRGRTGYGSLNSALSSEGLLGSGYTEYLDSSLNKEREDTEASLIGEYNHAIIDESIRYEEYIDELNSEMDDNYYRALNSIMGMGILDYDEAYREAVQLGYDEERAAKLAKVATVRLRFKLRMRVIDAILTKKYNYGSAANLALSYGLEYEDADELGRVARRINKAYSDTGIYPSSIVDYLKDLENKKRLEEEKK